MHAEMNEQPSAVAQDAPAAASRTRAGQTGMSYKFQRLREKIRLAISSGELAGKLPGERSLARKFHVNAKTLSKALTDLAAEGVLDRSIGRGTYVKGSAPAASQQGRWLVIADSDAAESPIITALRTANPELQVGSDVSEMRPSFLNQFAAVIDKASNTPESFLRDLVVRNVPVVAVNREPKTYSMHCVLVDLTLGATRLARDLALAGHRRIAVVEASGSTTIVSAVRNTMLRYAPDANVDACNSEDLPALVQSGVTACICDSTASAVSARSLLDQSGIALPAQISLAAVGCIGEVAPCSGYFCTAAQVAEAVGGLLRDAAATRPATLWLAGHWHDLGTCGPSAAVGMEEASPLRVGGMMA